MEEDVKKLKNFELKFKRVFFENIDAELLAEFKILAARSRLTMREIFIDMIKQAIKKEKYIIIDE